MPDSVSFSLAGLFLYLRLLLLHLLLKIGVLAGRFACCPLSASDHLTLPYLQFYPGSSGTDRIGIDLAPSGQYVGWSREAGD